MSFFWTFGLLLSITLVSASWRDSYNTIDGSQEVILVVESPALDLFALDYKLTEEDVSSLPFCSQLNSTLYGTTPCRDRPNFFTSLDYDEMTNTFSIITDRGPVVDCYSFPALQTENNTIGTPDTEGVYVPNYSPLVATFQLDGSSFANPQYTVVLANESIVTGLAKTSREGAMYGPECTDLPATEYPLSFDPSGVSPSGIRAVLVGNQSYHIVIEEFGPSVLILDTNYNILKGYVPMGSPSEVTNHGRYPVTANLPYILLQTQVSRSFSAFTDDETNTLYVFVEAPLGTYQTSTLVRVLQLNATDLMNIQYTGMYAFELESAKQYLTAGGSTSQLPLIGVVAADMISAKTFMTVERPNVMHPTSTFVHLDLSNATNLKDTWDQDLRLEQISAHNNALLLDNEEMNDQYRTKFSSLNPPVWLGTSQTLFNSRQILPFNDFSVDGEQVASLRVISDTVIAVGTDNNWGFTESGDITSKLYFIRLGSGVTTSLTNQVPIAGPAGNALVLSDSSSPDEYSQKKQWAVIQQTSAQEWDSLASTFTIEFWLYWRGGSQVSDFQPVVSRTNDASFGSAHFIVGVDISTTSNIESGAIRGVVGCSSDVGFDVTGASIGVEQWHHIAFVVTSSMAQVYVDGVMSGGQPWNSACSTSAIPSSNNPIVHLGDFAGLGVNGVLDELRFWKVARTSDQINAWMSHPLSGSEQGLVAYYQFNDVPSTQASPFEYQYFKSSVSPNGPQGLIQPVPTDKTRFIPSTVALTTLVTVSAVEESHSTPHQNVITLQGSDLEHDALTFSITELSPALVQFMNNNMSADSILFAQPNGTLNLTTLPAALSSNKVSIFVTCNDSMCSNFPSSSSLWFRYSVAETGSQSTAIVYLNVQACANLDACGVCNGDNSQCQCGCYHGFTADFMDYTLFKFLLDENLAKINELIQLLNPLVQNTSSILYNRWQDGYQYTDYTRYLEAQAAFKVGCLDSFCDTYNPWESEFYNNYFAWISAPADYNTCSCDQAPPDTEPLPPVYLP